MRREQNPRRPRQNKGLTDAAVQRERSQVDGGIQAGVSSRSARVQHRHGTIR
jgi:hypothetical protein